MAKRLKRNKRYKVLPCAEIYYPDRPIRNDVPNRKNHGIFGGFVCERCGKDLDRQNKNNDWGTCSHFRGCDLELCNDCAKGWHDLEHEDSVYNDFVCHRCFLSLQK